MYCINPMWAMDFQLFLPRTREKGKSFLLKRFDEHSMNHTAVKTLSQHAPEEEARSHLLLKAMWTS